MRGRKEPRRDTGGLFAPQVRLKKWELNGEKKTSKVKNQSIYQERERTN
jgi:hypothetical protein